MNSTASSFGTTWHLSFGSGSISVLFDSVLFFLIAVLLLTYLGLGVAAVLHPKALEKVGWMLAPYYGYAAFVLMTATLVAFGITVATSLMVILVLASVLNGWSYATGRFSLRRFGSPRLWLLLVYIALPSYLVTAVTMAHNGSMVYLGDQVDLYLLVPLTEWFKTHPSPLFSLAFPNGLVPYWDASLPPLSGWQQQGAHLGYANHRYDDGLFLFQWAPRYLESSLGLILGWDSYLTIRPAMAMMFALSAPSVYLLCRSLLKATVPVSLIAAALMVMNGTQFFWIMRIHAGQAVWTFLGPIIILGALKAVEERRVLPSIGVGLMVAAQFISYYQGAPLVVSLLGVALIGVAASRRSVRGLWQHGIAIALTTAVVAIPDHIKLLLVTLAGRTIQPAWRIPEAPISDVLGTSIVSGPYWMVAGKGQLGTAGEWLFQYGGMLATAVALLILVRLVVKRWRDAVLQPFWALVLGCLPILIYSRFFANGYIFSKAQAMITFLVVIGLALGMEGLFPRLERLAKPVATKTNLIQLASTGGLLLFFMMVAANFALSNCTFWKPVWNRYDPRSWGTAALGKALPAETDVRLSSGIMAGPEPIIEMIYSLRNQRVKTNGPMQSNLGDWLQKPIADAMESGHPEPAEGSIDLLGNAEIAASKGYAPSDKVWSDYLVTAYRSPGRAPATVSAPPPTSSTPPALPTRLPTTLSIVANPTTNAAAGTGRGDQSIGSRPLNAILTLASQGQAEVVIVRTSGPTQRLALPPGVSVRTVSVTANDRLELGTETGSRVHLLAVKFREAESDLRMDEDYSNLLAVFGESTLQGDSVKTRLTHLDMGMPVSLSLDIYLREEDVHPGWFELPLYPDSTIKDVEFRLDPALVAPQLLVEGKKVSAAYSTRPPDDGWYLACLTFTSQARVAKRIPLYSYRLHDGHISDFENWPLALAWDGSKVDDIQ